MALIGSVELDFKPVGDRFFKSLAKVDKTLEDLEKREQALNKQTEQLQKGFSKLSKVVGTVGAGLGGTTGFYLLNKRFNLVNKALSQLSKTSDIAQQKFKLFSKNVKSASGVVLSLGKAVDNNLLKRFKSLNQFVGGLSKAFKGLWQAIQKGVRTVVFMEGGIFAFSKRIRKLIETLGLLSLAASGVGSALGSAAGAVSGLSQMLTQFGNIAMMATTALGTLSSMIGTTFIRMGKRLSAAMDDAVASFAEWEQTLFSLRTAIKAYNDVIGISVANTKEFLDVIEEVSRETGFARAVVASGADTLLKFAQVTGLSAKAILDLTKKSAHYAQITGLDFQTIIIGIDNYFRGYTQTLKTVGIQVEEADLAHTRFVKGLGKSVKELNKYERAVAAAEAISAKMDATIKSAGDYLSATYQGLLRQIANQQNEINLALGEGATEVRKFRAGIELGLLKAFRKLTPDPLLKFVGAFNEGAASAWEFAGALLGAVANVGLLASALMALIPLLATVGGLWQALTAMGPLGLVARAILGVVGAVGAVGLIGGTIAGTKVLFGKSTGDRALDVFREAAKRRAVAEPPPVELNLKLPEGALVKPGVDVVKLLEPLERQYLLSRGISEPFGLPELLRAFTKARGEAPPLQRFFVPEKTQLERLRKIVLLTSGGKIPEDELRYRLELERARERRISEALVSGTAVRRMALEQPERFAEIARARGFEPSEFYEKLTKDLDKLAKKRNEVDKLLSKPLEAYEQTPALAASLENLRQELDGTAMSVSEMTVAFTQGGDAAERYKQKVTSAYLSIKDLRDKLTETITNLRRELKLTQVSPEQRFLTELLQRYGEKVVNAPSVQDLIRQAQELSRTIEIAQRAQQTYAQFFEPTGEAALARRQQLEQLSLETRLLKEQAAVQATRNTQAIQLLQVRQRYLRSLQQARQEQERVNLLLDLQAKYLKVPPEQIEKQRQFYERLHNARIEQIETERELALQSIRQQQQAWIDLGETIESAVADRLAQAFSTGKFKDFFRQLQADLENIGAQVIRNLIKNALQSARQQTAQTAVAAATSQTVPTAGTQQPSITKEDLQDIVSRLSADQKQALEEFIVKNGQLYRNQQEALLAGLERITKGQQFERDIAYLKQVAQTRYVTALPEGGAAAIPQLARLPIVGDIFAQAAQFAQPVLASMGEIAPLQALIGNRASFRGALIGGLSQRTALLLQALLSGQGLTKALSTSIEASLGGFEQVKDVFMAGFSAMRDAGAGFFESVIGGFKSLANNASNIISGIGSALGGTLGGFLGGLVTSNLFGNREPIAIGSNIGTAIGGTVGTIIAPGIGSFIGSFIGNILGGLIGKAFGQTEWGQIRHEIAVSVGKQIHAIVRQGLAELPGVALFEGGTTIGDIFKRLPYTGVTPDEDTRRRIEELRAQGRLRPEQLIFGQYKGVPGLNLSEIIGAAGTRQLVGVAGLYQSLAKAPGELFTDKRNFFMISKLSALVAALGYDARETRTFLRALTRTMAEDLPSALEDLNKWMENNSQRWKDYNKNVKDGQLWVNGYVKQLGALIDGFSELSPYVDGMAVAQGLVADRFREVAKAATDLEHLLPGQQEFLQSLRDEIDSLAEGIRTGDITLEEAVHQLNERLKGLQGQIQLGDVTLNLDIGDLNLDQFLIQMEDIQKRLEDIQSAGQIASQSLQAAFSKSMTFEEGFIGFFRGIGSMLEQTLTEAIMNSLVVSGPIGAVLDEFNKTLRTGLEDALKDTELAPEEAQGLLGNLRGAADDALSRFRELLPVFETLFNLSKDIREMFAGIFGDEALRYFQSVANELRGLQSTIDEISFRRLELQRDITRFDIAPERARARIGRIFEFLGLPQETPGPGFDFEGATKRFELALLRVGEAFASVEELAQRFGVSVSDNFRNFFDMIQEGVISFKTVRQARRAGLTEMADFLQEQLRAAGRRRLKLEDIGIIVPENLTLDQQIKALEELASAVNDLYQAEADKIQGIASQRIEALNKELEAIQHQADLAARASEKRIRGLQDELDAVNRWAGLAQDMDRFIQDLRNRLLFRGQTRFTRLDELNAQIAAARQAFEQAGSDEERAYRAQRLFELLQERLQFVEQFFQRPSREYQQILDLTIKQLDEIRQFVKGDQDRQFQLQLELKKEQEKARKAAEKTADRINKLNDQVYDIQKNVEARLKELGKSFGDIYKFIEDKLNAAMQQKLQRLIDIFGEDAASNLLYAPLSAIAENTQFIKQLLEDIRKNTEGLAGGNNEQPDNAGLMIAAPPTPQIVTNQVRQGDVHVTVPVNIEVQGGIDDESKIDRLASRIMREVEYSAKTGRLRAIVEGRFR